jgi:histidinol-phosphate/aromatic aminotransferase/cobyric acid decarboxylase-like protein
VVFVNPNNPTGTAIESEAILAFAASAPSKLVIVDESFADFSERPDLCQTCAGQLPPNVLVLKSLGKSLGVTGLRLGYARATAPELTGAIRSWLPIWNCNAFAEALLEMLPKHRRAIGESLAQTMRDRDAMKLALEHIPIVAEVWPSHGNFLLARLDVAEDRREELLDYLLDSHSIYIKDMKDRIGQPGCWVRLSVRTSADNERLYSALQASAEHLASSSPAIQR